MFVEAVEGLSAALSIYEQRKSVATILRRLGRYLVNGNISVAVFGPGGTGKSTLGSFLAGDLNTDEGVAVYKETLAVDSFRIGGSVPAKLIVPPGQIDRRPGNWDQLFAMLMSGKASRIINLVSWGYHSTELERSRVFPDAPDISDDAFIERYLNDGRKREIDALRDLVPHIKASQGPVHMITFVNKQDLWWHKRGAALDYFTKGEYVDIVSEIQAHKGKGAFQHDVVSAALIQQNLRTADGFEIAQTAGGYDDALRVTNLSRAAAGIQQMIGR